MSLIGANSELCIHPNLIVWPGSSILFGHVSQDSVVENSYQLPPEAVRVLRFFSKPKVVSEAFRSVSVSTLTTLSEAVAQGLLVLSDDVSAGKSQKFDGFYLSDQWPILDRHRLIQCMSRHIRVAGKSIFVLDDILSKYRQASIYRWLAQLPYLLHDSDTPTTIRYRHWIAPFTPVADYCSSVPFLEFLGDVAKVMFRSHRLTPCRAHAYCVPYGDIAFAHADFELGSGVTVIYFGNTMWPEEWGSEMLFYGAGGEPEIAVIPKPGRVIVFRGEIRHRGGAPTHLSHEPRYAVVIRLSLDPTGSGLALYG